jgi:flagellar biosynthesis/type III secretory pathway ATPase
VTLGAYTKGADKDLDEAMTRMPRIEAFLAQSPSEQTGLEATIAALISAVR